MYAIISVWRNSEDCRSYVYDNTQCVTTEETYLWIRCCCSSFFIYLYNIKGQPSLIIKNSTTLLIEMFIIIVYYVYVDIGYAINLNDIIIIII